MAERWVYVSQLLCGPNRHCIVGLIDEADSQEDAERKIGAAMVEPAAERFLAGGGNPWCAICGAPREGWVVEVRRTRFRTMEEAREPFAQAQAGNMLANALFGTHGPKPPGKPN